MSLMPTAPPTAVEPLLPVMLPAREYWPPLRSALMPRFLALRVRSPMSSPASTVPRPISAVAEPDTPASALPAPDTAAASTSALCRAAMVRSPLRSTWLLASFAV